MTATHSLVETRQRGSSRSEGSITSRIIIGTQRSEFTYDGLGRRVRNVEKTGGTVTSDKRFLWVGAEIVQERDATNAVTKRFNRHGVISVTFPPFS